MKTKDEGAPVHLTCSIVIAVAVVSVLASLVFSPWAGLFVILGSILIAWASKPKE